MTTKMKHQIVDANSFGWDSGAQFRENELHMNGASLLCFIEVPLCLGCAQ